MECPEKPCQQRIDHEMRRLEGEVRERLQGRLWRFQLVVFGDGIVLRGRTDTYYAKQLAQHTVMEYAPMPILANEIEVIP